ncbi:MULTISPECIES: GNAT family N-acetyltransferase [unclassified Bradyrhizobium]|uniref:GNAT family N-acetyltransferase n=1 Tax=unclassified Bradyrhizobium TaxID=2631580 RepID=UPI002342A679|nr:MULTISPECIES: GNAT family N-acetyltransferase [unclassified Bradyrhizobium]GLH86824.1 N-acetyltransferase [Bradyrhizobium sp. SSBR45R]
MNDIMIRPAIDQDAPAVASLHAASWRDTYANILSADFLSDGVDADRRAVWSQRLSAPTADQFVNVAYDPDGRLLGFICCYRDADPVWGSLVDNLHVAAATRGSGLGERLLRDAARLLAPSASHSGLHLWVFEANTAALRFYTRLGGRVVETGSSENPAAGGKTVLRVHWPDVTQLA